jgi:GT2 family glycosyltransferase
LKQSADPAAVEAVLRARPGRRPGRVSIVMLSWNALEYTKMALESIRAHTAGDYEIVIVDNGSNSETVEWLRAQSGIRVIYNATNRGYAGGNNQAIAACSGEYVVLLNNDVIVTDGWLESLLAAFDRIPGLGVSAPLSNNVAGHQKTVDSHYGNLDEMQAYARRRAQRHRREGYLTDRVIGLCMCIDRRVLEEIGGIDEAFGVGNFEDDDFCIRVRAAGYRIYVCADSFIHHFGSKTFEANKVDWQGVMERNWVRFARKWGYPERGFSGSYKPLQAIARGFDRSRHYVPLPGIERNAGAPLRPSALGFTADVRDERDWNTAGAFVRRYLRAFNSGDPVVLAIRTGAALPEDTVRARVAKAIERENVKPEDAPLISIGSTTSLDALAVVSIETLEDRSPSALRRLLDAPVRS